MREVEDVFHAHLADYYVLIAALLGQTGKLKSGALSPARAYHACVFRKIVGKLTLARRLSPIENAFFKGYL